MSGYNLNLKRAVFHDDDGWQEPNGDICSNSICCSGTAYNEHCGKEQEVSLYKDKSDIVPLALAAILISFVDDELDGLEGIQKKIDEFTNDLVEFREEHDENESKTLLQSQISDLVKIRDLYRWWTVTRVNLITRSAEVLKESNFGDFANHSVPDIGQKEYHVWDLDSKINADTKIFCTEIVSIMESMWT